MKCKAIGGLIRYLTRVIPDGLLLSIAHVRFTWFNKCKRFAGLNFKCKLEVGLIIKNCQLFSGRGTVSKYDAFPSGHMGTMMTTTVILADNYPEKRWIGPVGYSVMEIVGLSRINNGVHWASDYPLAIGMGYVFGKVTVKMNRWIRHDEKGKR